MNKKDHTPKELGRLTVETDIALSLDVLRSVGISENRHPARCNVRIGSGVESGLAMPLCVSALLRYAVGTGDGSMEYQSTALINHQSSEPSLLKREREVETRMADTIQSWAKLDRHQGLACFIACSFQLRPV